MAVSISTTAAAVLKELYPDGVIENLVYDSHPFLSMLKKKEKMSRANIVPVIIGNTARRSTTFANTVLDASSAAITGESDARKFVVLPAKDYAVATVDSFELEASESYAGIVDMLKMNVDGAISAVSNSISQSLFSDGTGVVGAVTSVVALKLTLTESEDIVNFEVGQVVVTASGTHTGIIESIDRSAGTFTMVAGATIVTADTNIFIRGDENNKLTGLAGWLPYSLTTATLWSLDRSVDRNRLAGISHDASGAADIVVGLLDGAAALAREGGAPDVCFVNFAQFNAIVDVVGADVLFRDRKDANLGFEALNIRGPNGPIKVVADRNCPDAYAYMLTMKSWELISTGKCVRILDRDAKALRKPTADAYEIRVASYSQLTCNAPGHNAVIKLP